MSLLGIPPALWPIHLRPEADELLSSWMVRFAHAHGLRVEAMCTAIFGSRSPIWNRDIDRSMPGHMLQQLSVASALPVSTLEGCMLSSFAGVISEEVNPRGFSGGILPLGIYHRKRTKYSLMYCPDCLVSDEYPHFRKSWRLSFVSVCLQHGVGLLDRCNECLAQIVPHRVDMKWRVQTTFGSCLHTLCHNCGKDLRRAKGTTVTTEDLAAGKWIAQALHDNWVRIGDSMVYGPAFFAGLATLIRAVNNPIKGCRGFDVTPLDLRRWLLRDACALLEDWPSNFLKAASERRWTTASLLREYKPIPFWLYHVIKLNIDMRRALISQEEAAFIVGKTAINGRVESLARARQISGRMIEKHHLPQLPDTRFDDEAFSSLLAQIDHQVSRTFNEYERAHLLADKIIFALARVYGFTQSQIVALSLSDVVPLANNRKPNFWTAPTSKVEVGAWIGWYLNSIRPLLHPAKDVTTLFVGRVGGRPLTANAIGERFAGYRKSGYLHRQIISYRGLAS